MDVLRVSSPVVTSSYNIQTNKTQFCKPLSHNFPFKSLHKKIKISSKSKLFTSLSASTEWIEPKVESESEDQKFDWYSHWYPVMPVCDLDKRAPHAKKVLGLDLVLWWDRNEKAWKVFDDTCPHRLAPLSEGRIDPLGRLQCVYHGWCFNGSGDCKLIPQAPPNGPPVQTFKKACVTVYPTTVQHDIVWFWPNSNPQYRDILTKKKPPYIPELDDPSFSKLMGNRDIPYGYEVLLENLMDPAHAPYTHYGILQTQKPKIRVDREGGRPFEMTVKKLDADGFTGMFEGISADFFSPCVFRFHGELGNTSETIEVSSQANRKLVSMIFMCIPISPGNCRLIWTFPRNFGFWIDKIVPRWMFHIKDNLILDSDLYLLHLEERKIMDTGTANWEKACFVPTKSDAFVVGYRRWLNKYAGTKVDWKGKFSGALPPSPPKDQLMDRYWSHVVNCMSCNTAYKRLKVLEVALHVIPIISIGIVAAMKQGAMPMVARTTMVSMAILCFAASRWLAYFIYKNFHCHDYNHAFR